MVRRGVADQRMSLSSYACPLQVFLRGALLQQGDATVLQETTNYVE